MCTFDLTTRISMLPQKVVPRGGGSSNKKLSHLAQIMVIKGRIPLCLSFPLVSISIRPVVIAVDMVEVE